MVVGGGASSVARGCGFGARSCRRGDQKRVAGRFPSEVRGVHVVQRFRFVPSGALVTVKGSRPAEKFPALRVAWVSATGTMAYMKVPSRTRVRRFGSLRALFAGTVVLTLSACIDSSFTFPPLDPATFPPIEIPAPAPVADPPPAPAAAPAPPQVQDFGVVAIYEAHRPNSTGNTGTEKCTTRKKNCDKANIEERARQAEENKKKLVNAAANAVESGQKATVTVPAATDFRCGENSASGKIPCDSNLAQQRATTSAKEIQADLKAQGVQSVRRKNAADCPDDPNIVCIVTVAQQTSGTTTARSSLSVAPVAPPPVVDPFDACPNLPGIQSVGTSCVGDPFDACPNLPGDQPVGTDCGTGSNTGRDTGSDTGSDTGRDTGRDTGSDTGRDTGGSQFDACPLLEGIQPQGTPCTPPDPDDPDDPDNSGPVTPTAPPPVRPS
jgi:hypothetical protein